MVKAKQCSEHLHVPDHFPTQHGYLPPAGRLWSGMEHVPHPVGGRCDQIGDPRILLIILGYPPPWPNRMCVTASPGRSVFRPTLRSASGATDTVLGGDQPGGHPHSCGVDQTMCGATAGARRLHQNYHGRVLDANSEGIPSAFGGT